MSYGSLMHSGFVYDVISSYTSVSSSESGSYECEKVFSRVEKSVYGG